jgi:hypothetical protein
MPPRRVEGQGSHRLAQSHRNQEKDNLMLDEWFKRNRISTQDWEFNTIFVNGSNNLPNLQLEGDTWKVRLIEEEFSNACGIWGLNNGTETDAEITQIQEQTRSEPMADQPVRNRSPE